MYTHDEYVTFPPLNSLDFHFSHRRFSFQINFVPTHYEPRIFETNTFCHHTDFHGDACSVRTSKIAVSVNGGKYLLRKYGPTTNFIRIIKRSIGNFETKKQKVEKLKLK